jgi:ferredoxin
MTIKRINPILNTVRCGRVSVPLKKCESCHACLNIEFFDDEPDGVVFCDTGEDLI